LLFLTNDGEFALRLTHPRYGIRKKYVVTFEGRADAATLAAMKRGVWHEGDKLKAESARQVTKSVMELELAEGKNREVRRLFESQGLGVRRLQRTQIGKIKLGELKTGRWRVLTDAEIKTLLS
jgi:23S rRNA pseudouridine2605 synthase